MITFGASTWLWTSPFNMESIGLLSKIKNMGFDAVEIAVEYPSLINIKDTKKALLDLELVPIICGAFGPGRDLTHSDPKVHQACLDYVEACFEISNELGSKFVAGPMYAATGKARQLEKKERQREWQLAVANLQKVCELASKHNQLIAIEPLNRFETDMVNTAEDVMQLIGDVQHPAAKVMMDSFHMTLEERDIKSALGRVGEDLIHVQVSENYRGTPGTGLTPWIDFRDGLRSIGYNGVVSIESFTPDIQELAGAVCFWKPMVENQDDLASEGLAFLRELFKVN